MKKEIIIRNLGSVAIFCGVVCIVIKAIMTETIDADGFLHEAFFLLPMGFALISGGAVMMAIGSISMKKKK